MPKLAALLAFIRDAKAIAPERIEAVVESGETDFSGSRARPDLLLYRLRYTAAVELWGAAGSLTHLLALVEVWLAENGGDRKRNFLASFAGEPVDDRRSDITLRLELEEDVRYLPAEAGYAGADRISYAGAEWKPGLGAADLALTIEGLVVEVPL
jgi:P2 phage tail completion protein R (GpR)